MPAKRLTKHQQRVVQKLQKGDRIRCEIAGYFWPNGTRVRYATVDALIAAGLVKKQSIQGKFMRSDYLVFITTPTD